MRAEFNLHTKTLSADRPIRAEGVHASFCILLGREPEFNYNAYDASDESVSHFVSTIIGSDEFSGVVERSLAGTLLPHFHNLDASNLKRAATWAANHFGDPTLASINNWWELMYEYMDIVAGFRHPFFKIGDIFIDFRNSLKFRCDALRKGNTVFENFYADPDDIFFVNIIMLGAPSVYRSDIFESKALPLQAYVDLIAESEAFLKICGQINVTKALPHERRTDPAIIAACKAWLKQYNLQLNEFVLIENWWDLLDAFLSTFSPSVFDAQSRRVVDRCRLDVRKVIRQKRSIEPVKQAEFEQRLRKSGLFSDREYLLAHPECRSHSEGPMHHYLNFGRAEMRPLYRPEYGAALLGEINRDYPAKKKVYEQEIAEILRSDVGRDGTEVRIYCHTRGNYFMRPIAEALQRSLSKFGVPAVCADENRIFNNTGLNIVVAPHEFFMQPLPPECHSDDFRRTLFLLNTEQVPSKYFAMSLPFFLECRGLIDLSFHTAELMSKSIPTLYFMPPIERQTMESLVGAADFEHPLFKHLDRKLLDQASIDTPLKIRPLDVFFAGFANNYRDSFFLRNAEYLAGKSCFFAYTRERSTPASSGVWSDDLIRNNSAVTSLCKVTLAIHRYPTGYIEWERMLLQGFAAGACVLATPGIQIPQFQPNEHYVEAPLHHFGRVLRYLLKDPAGQREAQTIATRAQQALFQNFRYEISGKILYSFLRKHAG